MADDKLSIQVDFSKSGIDDWVLIARARKGLDFDDIPLWVEFLDRVVVGGAKAFPMTALKDVIAAVSTALAEQSNPKAPTA